MSQTVFIIGMTGGTGSRLARQLVAKGDTVRGLVRRQSQSAQWQHGIETVTGDLTQIAAGELAAAMAGCDVVVFTAGAGGEGGDEMTDAVDGRGVILAAEAAQAAGIRRFYLVSAFPDAWREKRMPPDFEHYMFVKRQADVYLASTTLDWMILRPGTLTNSPGKQRVRLGLAIPYGDVSRDDVAGVLVSLIHAPHIRRCILELTEGERAIDDAVKGLAG